ncbi:Ig-like domain-containing protein, partial [Neobacillus niacini]|uniref:Ig-like domain-containing protein n=1 Tax=Neobacillus niacini TaxID=86668 RepID=UPI003000935C
MYEALFPINESTKPGEWGISSVEVRDIEYNNKYYSDGEDFDFTNADFTVINENADITPPTIQEVSVNKKVANNGDEVTVSLTVVDDKSGVNRVTVDFRNNAGRSQLGEGIYNESTQKYDVKFKVSDNTRPGNWFVNSIYVVDGEWNSKDYRNGMDGNDFSAAEFTVINENADVTPPTLLGVSVDKNSLQVGEEVTISLDVKDEQSDIGYINVNYKLPNRSYKNAQAYFNSLTGKYEAKIEIGQYAKSGTWVIEDVNVQDTEGNSKYIFNNKASSGYQGIEGMDLSSGNFVVKNDNEDSTPPEVRSMTVNKTQFVPGETAIVELDVFDHQSGVNDVYIAFSGSNNGYVHTSAYYNETTHKYEAQIQVDDSTRPGLWSLEYIYVNDNEGNYQNLDSDEYDFSSANYSIINEAVDIIPPSVNSISVDKQEVKAGEEITISLDVKDDQSTVEEVSAVLTSNNDNDPWGFAGHVNESAIYNEGTHKFELKLQIPEDMKPGSWGIQYLTVSDSEGNTAEMYQEEHADLLSGSTFTVINDQADVAVPTFSGITADKKVVNVGEEITFSVDATDESGIQDVFVVLDGMMDTYSGAIYNEKTNKYDIAIPITEYYKPGTWKVQLVTIYDKENNGIVLNSDDVDFSELDFEIINDKFVDYMDNPADYINSISVDKNAAAPGDIVTLNINFKDSYNLRNVDVWYAGGTNNNFNREAFYNEKTGNYEVKIPITTLYKPAFWSLRGIYAQKIDGTLLNLFTNEIVDFTKGDFSVTNSKLDSVAPVAPEVDEVTDQTSTVTGKTEAKVKVIVKAGDQELGTAISDWEGKFSIAIDAQSAGTELSVIAMDSSENTSSAANVTVVDTTPPSQPEVNDVFDNVDTVSGIGEAGATVTVIIGENVYNGTVDSAGTFTVEIPLQKAGTSITVTLQDAAGNSSEAVTTTVIDKTPPTAPIVDAVTDQDTTIAGTTEANAEVTVKVGETVIGSGKADGLGKFSIVVDKQAAETKISVFAKDKAENISTTEIVVAASYSPIKVQLNGRDFALGGYFKINT